MKKFFYILLSVVLLVTSMSCEMPAPQLTEKDTSPFQRPRTPQNVQVISGQPDRITISWDHQDDATGFIIYGSRISNIDNGMKQVARVRENVDSVDLLLRNADFDASQSYVFTVRAYKQFEGSSDILYSLDSEKKEGAFAPSRLDLNVALTKEMVKIYYNSPNLYSGLNVSQETKPLYNAKFTVMYKDIIEDAGWVEPSTVSSTVDFAEPTLYTELSINDEQFVDGRRYLFKVIMDIEQPDGSFYSLTSREVELIVSGDMLPSPIAKDNIIVSQGDYLDKITLSWNIPAWTYPVTRENSYFKIQRSANGAIWEDVVDEITTKTHDEKILNEPDSLTCTFIDTNVEVGASYQYRIVNAAQNVDDIDAEKYEQGFYVQDEVPEASDAGYLYDPILESFTGTWTKTSNDGKSADINLEWKLKNNKGFEGLTWNLYSVELRAGFDNYISDMIYDTAVVSGQDVYSHGPHSEVYSGTMYSNYYYGLSILNNGVLYKTFDLVADFGAAGDLVLGVYKPVPEDKPLIDVLNVSNDRHGKIVITWKVNRPEGYDPAAYTYEYKFNEEGSDYASLSITNDGDVYTGIIDGVADKAMKGIYLKVDAGKASAIPEVYIPENMLNGKILSLPENLEIKSYKNNDKVFLEWTGCEFTVTNDVEYSYGVRKYKTETAWTTRPIENINSGKIEVDPTLVATEDLLEFAIIAHNSKDEVSEYVESVNTSLMLPVLDSVQASKGESKSEVFVRWTDATPDIEYKIYRYGADLSALEEISQEGNAVRSEGEKKEFTDKAPNPEKPYYTVALVKDGIEGVIPFKFNIVSNNIGLDEYENMGYVFGLIDLAPVAVSHLDNVTHELQPWFSVVFKVDPAVKTYEITDGLTTLSFEIGSFKNIDATGVVKCNDKLPSEVGYATYDTQTGELTAHVRFNALGRNLAIDGLKVKGIHSKVEVVADVTGEARRSLDEYDYIYIANCELDKVLNDAHMKFNEDWWGGTQVFQSGARSYGDLNSDHFHVTSISGVEIASRRPGTLKFWEYPGSFFNVSISTDGANHIELQCDDTDSTGYLGTDTLSVIGNNEDGNLLKIEFPEKFYMDNVEIYYQSAEITYNKVHARDIVSGHYKVKIGDGRTVKVNNNESVLKHIYVRKAPWV